MYNSEIIQRNNHFEYIKHLKQAKDKLYFLVKENDDKVGVVYFTNILARQSAEIGIYSNPFLKGKGTTLMNILLKYGQHKLLLTHLFAQVFSNNTKAIKLYMKYGFKEIDNKTYNSKKIIIMRKD